MTEVGFNLNYFEAFYELFWRCNKKAHVISGEITIRYDGVYHTLYVGFTLELVRQKNSWVVVLLSLFLQVF